MIKAFSFDGRINRLEYVLSIFFVIVCYVVLTLSISNAGDSQLLVVFFLPLFWFNLAQGSKRCHDIDKSGYWQILPHYFFLMMFQKGNPLANQYNTDGSTKFIYDAADYERPFTIDGPTASAIDPVNENRDTETHLP